MLRALRTARGVTQAGFAAQLGVGTRTVERWERGSVAPDATAEAELLAYCDRQGLYRHFDEGVLAGMTLSPGWLRNLLAAAVDFGEEGQGGAEQPAPPPEPDEEDRFVEAKLSEARILMERYLTSTRK